MKGQVFRSTTGIGDGTYYGGQFSAETTNPSSGSMHGMYAIGGNTILGGTGATTMNEIGIQYNGLAITNANATVNNAYGIPNKVLLNAPMTLNSTIGIFDNVSVGSNGIYTNVYGSASFSVLPPRTATR